MKWLLWLGHGRMLEAHLGYFKILVGMAILLPTKTQAVPLSDLAWFVSESIIAVPFIVVGAIQIIGLTLNINGFESSWKWRAAGAALAIVMWFWIIWKCVFFGAFGPFAFPCAVAALPSSVILLAKAINRLPIPGAVGAS